MKLDPRTGRPFLLPKADKLTPDYALEDAPKAVRDANEAARVAIEAGMALRDQRNAARDACEAAAVKDRQALKEAIATGQPEPAATLDSRKAEAAKLEDRLELAKEGATEKVRHLAYVVAAEADAEWKQATAERLTALEAEASKLANRLAGVYSQIEDHKSVLSTLHHIDPDGDVKVWFQTRRRRSPSDEPLAKLSAIARTAIATATEGDSGAERRAQRQQERAERDRRRAEKGAA